ncbi:MAG: aminotransferase class I/II-fold pyridoxal phosphate-dependent enzyme [Deltaproteobacteria bacterium]|nr:MAG: aminotransferase class I/II-fold pyridoxal phosphate-dependent enzyme [Deltaproteobacteria bacterium]
MSLSLLNAGLAKELAALEAEGRAKAPERVIVDYVPPQGDRGPRYKLRGSDQLYIRMNSNSYLSLSHHPDVLAAADEASHRFGAGPGAVRFIDGTFAPHVELEERIAAFCGRPAAKIFNSAYTTNLGLALALQNRRTFWIGDALNHNCIIRAMRIANVPREHKAIFAHNDMEGLRAAIESVDPAEIDRVIVIFDGVFSMRGDHAPIAEINEVLAPHRERFAEGLVTVVDDSHGIGAYGPTGRGTEEVCGAEVDIVVGTFGKAFGVNGGFVAASPEVVEAVRQKADTYIYTNPLSVADCAAAKVAIDIADSDEGRRRLAHIQARIAQFRAGIARLGLETIDGNHPVVPLMVRDTDRTRRMVRDFFDNGVLVVGLNYPVVPEGDQTIRFQINAAHTESDIDEVLSVLERIR